MAPGTSPIYRYLAETRARWLAWSQVLRAAVVTRRGLGLELGLTLLAEQGWPSRLSADGGKAHRMLTVLAINLGTLGLALLPCLPQRHSGSLLAMSSTRKLSLGLPTASLSGKAQPSETILNRASELASSSVSVRRCTSAAVAVVTQLDTQSLASPRAHCRSSI
jgi:hypothetical protein